MTTADKKKIFYFSAFTNPHEKTDLARKIRKLGGIARELEAIYQTELTHVIVPDSWNPNSNIKGKGWTSLSMGAFGSYKFLLKEKYVEDSFKEKRFLCEETYIPEYIVDLRKSYMSRRKKQFQNQTVVILMDDQRRQMELKNMVRDAGANVLNWNCKDLALKRNDAILKIDVVYTGIVSIDKGLTTVLNYTFILQI